MVKIRQTFK